MSEDLDLLIVESNDDFVAVKRGYCKKCVEKKLNTTIIRIMPINNSDFFKMKKNGLKGYRVECKCSDMS
jgi:hypothetical protein